MGDWGFKPWDNDCAADWYGEFFEKTRLATYVEETLNQDINSGYPDEIRAAAFVLTQLGHIFIWPGENLAGHLKLAIEKLEAIRKLEDFQEIEGYVSEINNEIAELRARLQSLERPSASQETRA
jgi:hypothetical protein